MKNIWPLILILALGLLGFQYQQNQAQEARFEKQLAKLSYRDQKSGGKAKDDPYLAGPVKNTIIKSAKDLQGCYLTLLKTKPTVTAGKLKLDWQINPEGGVFSAGVVSNELGDVKFGDCVVGKIKNLQFPIPPSGISKYVEHSLYFKDEAALAADEAARKAGPLVQLNK